MTTTPTPAESLHHDVNTLTLRAALYRGEQDTLRATIARASRNLRRATTARAQNRNADIIASAEYRITELDALISDDEKWITRYTGWATEAEQRAAETPTREDAITTALANLPATPAAARRAHIRRTATPHTLPTLNRGTYRPYAPNARTLADTRPLYVNGTEQVTVEVDTLEASVFFGLRLVATRPATDFTHSPEIHAWAQQLAADAPATPADMVAAVKAHASKPENYNAGWDTVVECYTDEEITKVLRDAGATTPAAALEMFGELASIWEDRRKTADWMFSY